MHYWIALFRGINVGGKHLLPMAQLRQLMADLGHQQIKTYIQSGNCVFATPRARNPATMAQRIEASVEEQFEFSAPVLVLPVSTMQSVVQANPFPNADPKRLQIFFPWHAIGTSDDDALAQWATASESFVVQSQALYLHAPDGIGRSKLASKVDQSLGVRCTARNLNTCHKLLALAADNHDA